LGCDLALSGVVRQPWSSVPYLPSCFQLKRFTRYMSAIGALETVALTQVYRHGPTLPVSDYPNLSATTIVRRMIGERLMLCRVRLMAHESSNCVGFQRGTPSHQGQTTEDDSSHDYRTLSQPTGGAASPCNACAGGSVAGCCNDTSTACAGSSGCPHFGQFMRKVSYGARRWRLAASRNFTTGVTTAAAFCERSLSNNERRHRPAEVLRTASNRQIEITVTTQGVPVAVFTRQHDCSESSSRLYCCVAR